jgi:hypothetical protein
MSVKAWLNERPGAALDDAAREAAAPPAPTAMEAHLFDPRTQVSADAKYIVRNLVLWFLVLPAVLGGLWWAITR